MTPETIMAALEERGPLPRKAPRAAGECREAMVPMFPAYVDRLLELDVDALDEEGQAFVYHLLAEWRETRAYRPVARLLRRDPAFVDTLMGDGITKCVARVVWVSSTGLSTRYGPRSGTRTQTRSSAAKWSTPW